MEQKLTNKKIIFILKKAKSVYIGEIEKDNCIGLCTVLTYTLKNHHTRGKMVCNAEIIEYIPKFNSKFLIGENISVGFHWWKLSDSKSRIEALDKLIAYYEEVINKEKGKRTSIFKRILKNIEKWKN